MNFMVSVANSGRNGCSLDSTGTFWRAWEGQELRTVSFLTAMEIWKATPPSWWLLALWLNSLFSMHVTWMLMLSVLLLHKPGRVDEAAISRQFWQRRGVTRPHQDDILLRTRFLWISQHWTLQHWCHLSNNDMWVDILNIYIYYIYNECIIYTI